MYLPSNLLDGVSVFFLPFKYSNNFNLCVLGEPTSNVRTALNRGNMSDHSYGQQAMFPRLFGLPAARTFDAQDTRQGQSLPGISFIVTFTREIELIAVTLMTSSKTCAPELKVIARDFY